MESEKWHSTISGNTKPEIVQKKRMFQLTLNHEKNDDIKDSEKILDDKYIELMKYLTKLKYRYIITCKETNKKGFKHYHIFIQFEHPHKLSIKKCQGAHIEICRGSVDENIKYIKKEGNIIDELGTPKYISSFNTINDIIKTKNIDDLFDMDCKYYNIIKRIKQDYKPTYNTKKTVILIHNIDDIERIDKKYFKDDFQFMSVDELGFINKTLPKLIISSNKINTFNINFIFKKYNIPINNMYPSDIESIIIIDNSIDFKNFYNKLLKMTNKCDYDIIDTHKKIIKVKILDEPSYGEIDSDEIEEIDTDEDEE